MNNQEPPDSQDDLEQWVARHTQALPLRRAPQTLSARVATELQRRAAMPWWRKSFLYWPFAARIAFVALCMGLANASVALLRWLSAERSVDLSVVLSRPVTWTQRLIEAATNLQTFFELVVRHLPTAWLYGGLLTVIILYVTLLGIGAAAYRTLYVGRQHNLDQPL
jgi:hypothetical protein